jgi:alpha-amylase/alpha-mannosidase (GH57 family)
MERSLCIHGHFYQPPRENPWLEAIEIQDSAHPHHDWNERVTAECYAPNSASRILDGERRILDIASNYEKMSFNFGPTLLSWMKTFAPETYQAILDADRKSMELRSGHGNAIAQAYNHLIMPLANARDKRTQIIWGIRDFENRFKRFPEGMWLPETAVDTETLELLSEAGVRFTILAPHQASRIRQIGAEEWEDVSGSRVDPARVYLCKLPSGRAIHLFFYDGPISRAVAFEDREWPQILTIATDGETYGHHREFGDMALAYALHHIEKNGIARLTNYGEYLEKHPPDHEVQIFENTSWSCFHGVERWRSNCGCNSGSHPGWHQEWRAPLRQALDWLRDELAARYELKSREYLNDPWQARDDYIGIVLNRLPESAAGFFEKHAAWALGDGEKVFALKLLEIQRHAMLMYTSCGWFFDELSGLETVQVIQYAARAIQLSAEVFHDDLEQVFLEKLARAKSNLPLHGDGVKVYEHFVKPVMVDLHKVAAHYGISSLFEDYPERAGIYCYTAVREDYERLKAGPMDLAVGRAIVSSEITGEAERISFSVLHLGDQDFNGGVFIFRDDEAYRSMKEEITTEFKKGAFAEIVRLMDNHFGMHTYSLLHLFRDEQRKVLNHLIAKTLDGFEAVYRGIYENNTTLMTFLRETGMPVPRAYITAAEFILLVDLRKAFAEDAIDADKIRGFAAEVKQWNLPPYAKDLEFTVTRRVEDLMDKISENPSDGALLTKFQDLLELLRSLPLTVNFWQVQNRYYALAKTAYREQFAKAHVGDKGATEWVKTFETVGQLLFFNTGAVLPQE